jgi:hypothetical protein
MKRALEALLFMVCLIAATPQTMTVTTQVLDYEKGYIFFTTGDGFHVAPDAVIVNGPVVARRYVRVTFDATGVVTRIEVSEKKFPPEGDVGAVARYAVALSSPAPNPDLIPQKSSDRCSNTRPGKLVTVAITVQAPPSTAFNDQVYMTSDQSGWNAEAYRLDRVDALHYRTVLKLYSGTVMHVLFDRGSTQSIQVGENGIDIKPYLLCVGDEDAQAFTRIVYRWGDEQSGPTQTIPQVLPTPYNPAPFPGLPTPPPGTIH